MRTTALLACAAFVALGAAPASQADAPTTGRLFIYPTQGQSQGQLDQDRYECHTWARQQSGFDPTSFATSTPTQRAIPNVVPVAPNPAAGATAKGALAGAVVGSVIGSHHRDAVGGAVLGAAVGSIAGGTIETEGQRTVEREARSQASQIVAQRSIELSALEQRKADYRRAIAACLEGRGYTVR